MYSNSMELSNNYKVYHAIYLSTAINLPPILNHPLPLGFPVAGVVERKLIRNEMLSLSRTQNH